jgi:UDP-N-acetylglucosamine diphosphorylase / glucose-1-phosphate thymidylyltransferase / UDP-N-acetylgalactosamine diphosphorylase / glucosamine-1-phosphate N-acetyltransferase / galactosamine-1-phosphate N-acetyltransferase
MRNLILFDDQPLREKLKPLTLTRPIASFRIGIDTIAEKWEAMLGLKSSVLTDEYLVRKFPCHYTNHNIYVNGSIIPDQNLVEIIGSLNTNEALYDGENLIAICTNTQLAYPIVVDFSIIKKIVIATSSIAIRQLSDIFIYNGKQLQADFQRITSTISSQKLSDRFTVLYNESNIFFGTNVSVKSAVLDATLGPIFIDDNATIEIGALLQGPCYVGKNSIISLGSKIRSNTTIGPYCKVGGEVSKSVIFGYSNKSHDGFMGCSVVGEWCNWGAGTNNSNLKNDYGMVSMYDYSKKNLEPTNQLFAGCIMGDYGKTAIGTNINTGTVIGVSCNLFQNGFPAKFVPSFTWGGSADASTRYKFVKAIEVIKATMLRRSVPLTDLDIEILNEINQNVDS